MEFNYEKVAALLAYIARHNHWVRIVDESDFLYNATIRNVPDPEAIVLKFEWSEDGLEYEAEFTGQNLSDATTAGNFIFLQDATGRDVQLDVCKLVAADPFDEQEENHD